MLTKACILEDEAISSFKAAIGIEYGYEVMVGVMSNLHFALNFGYYVEVHEK
jgi:phosphohistidine swiveling domain-containing protein